MPAPREVSELVERFDRNRESYRSSEYNETETRREFIDPFFKALGWDIDNEQGYAEAYKDVVHEDAIKISGATKAPDYAFRIGGARKFFVEAKRPGVDIKNDPDPAYQLRRYAWSAKLPLSILTDFEEFAVYDGRIRPAKTDKASTARVLYLTYTEYEARWDEITAIFSREEILKGSFDKYVESSKKKRGTAEVDDAFLKEIENWRDLFARNIALRNPDLSTRELNYAVQRTVDRIIFLRICVDRGIEDYGQLMALQSGTRAYERLCQIFRRADERYNSGLFHFGVERERSDPPDDLTLNLTIDDKVLKEVFKGLYYPESPFEFSVLPADILGHIYEQFLGKVIRLTSGHHAKVEDKPEVKKAGGVYYTPTYIVDYIVKNTVGKLLEGNTPTKVAKIRVLDPACGSGSFLLGAYQCLLDWHQEWYAKHDPQKHAKGRSPKVYQGPGGEWRLTTAEKKRILLNNIYGVDIDTQAVEVTKLSLLLKVLEGENAETLGKSLRLFHERALPDLGENIKCGNSLIGPDFYEEQQLSLLDDEERYRINAFDWNAEFPEIMEAGGFDAVIGNPPWGSLFTESEKKYLSVRYVNRRGKAESHLFFIEWGFRLLNNLGILGFITPNTWLSVLNSKETREYLLDNATFYEICELSKYIFRDAPDIVPILVFLGKNNGYRRNCIIKRTEEIRVHSGNFNDAFSTNQVPQEVWQRTAANTINLRSTPSTLQIIEKCDDKGERLSEICTVLYGIKTGNNKKYLSTSPSDTHRVKALKTGELIRYYIEWKGVYLCWCPELAGYRASSLEVPKITVQYIRKLSLPRRIIAALDTEGTYYPLNNYSYVTLEKGAYSLKYILGVLNSSLLNFYFANTFIDYNIKPTYLQQLPIRTINFDNSADIVCHDRIVEVVERMLELHNQLAVTKTNHEKTAIQRQIDATDKQMDQLVYELYALTEKEIRIVEEATHG